MSLTLSRLIVHCTPQINRFRVSIGGLSTKLDARKKGRIWLCDIDQAMHVCNHLTGRDNLTIRWYSMFQVSDIFLRKNPIKKCGRKGIYYSENDIPFDQVEYLCQLFVHLDCDDLFCPD